jgi:histidyl-tRNA synthetase
MKPDSSLIISNFLDPLPTQAYKGVRDFLPQDYSKKEYIFNKWRRILKQNGFQEYETSLLESADLYIAKSGEELGSKQLYSFEDKGGRKVALRPEQTPSLARLVAGNQRALKLPVKWFSIPNCFRYEQPQKGRYREHWQLNVDIVGLEAGGVETEIMMLLGQIFLGFGANRNQFRIDFNHRGVLDEWLAESALIEYKEVVYKVLDGWYKQDQGQKKEVLKMAGVSDNKIEKIFNLADKKAKEWEKYLDIAKKWLEIGGDFGVIKTLSQVGQDVDYNFNPCIIRGIAYYTGLVFEAFDKNPENPRSLFGGGRYDNLLELFGEHQPAIGFGFGDATMHEFLSGWGLYPENLDTMVDVGILMLSPESFTKVYSEILPNLRELGKNWLLDYAFERSENKRYESLKKRGCVEILKV